MEKPLRYLRRSNALLAFALLVLQPSLSYGLSARAVRDGAYDEWISASVLRVGSDTLVVLNPKSSRPETLSVRSLGIVEMETGRHPSGKRMLQGATAGAVIGVFAGGIGYWITQGDCRGADYCGFGALGAAGIGCAIGLGIGFAVGSVPAPSWDRLYVSPAARRWLNSQRWPYTGP